jgi:ATP-dependent DNA ligase
MFAAMLRSLPAGFIVPCLPTKADTLPSGEMWLHEIKHDGFRIIARKGWRMRSKLGKSLFLFIEPIGVR